MSNPLVDMDPESDEEGDHHGPFVPHHHPYSSSYGFAATSWELRKNLTETFDQHVDTRNSNNNNNKTSTNSRVSGDAAENSDANTVAPHPTSNNAVSEKIAHFEQKSTGGGPPQIAAPALVKKADLSGKPPRQPAHGGADQSTTSNAATATTNGKKSKADKDKRCVSVFLRVRPPTEGTTNTIEVIADQPPTKIRAHAPQSSNAAKMDRESSSSSLHQSIQPSASSSSSDAPAVVREFTFQQVFGPEQTTEDVYTTIVAPMVDKMFPSQDPDTQSINDPESGLLLAYGATNAGKTYTILGKAPSEGQESPCVDQEHSGIVPRAFKDIINHIAADKIKQPKHIVDLYLSYFEIYNDNIYDLLDERSTSNSMFMREQLKLRESHKQTFVRGLVKKQISDVEEGLSLARQASSRRHTSSNNLNSGSSRSHCICQLQVVRRLSNAPNMREGSAASSTGYNTDEEGSRLSKLKSSTLFIVDLAGIERSKRTNVGALRQKEASLINKSLMNLMRCLSIMRENQSISGSASNVIPFRDNKLTHLFMPIFTGRSASSISMIVNVNPAAPDFDETNHVLSYASKAKMVRIEEKTVASNASQNSNAEKYGYNGRPIKKTKTAASKIASLVRKLSPKKLMKKASNNHAAKKKVLDSSNYGDRKRKAMPQPGRVPSFSASSTASTESQNIPKTKRMRVVKPGLVNPAQKSSSSINKNSEKDDAKSLKMALSIAQAEIELLKSENSTLRDDLATVETKVREEVCDEMDNQLENTKRHYLSIIDQLKSQQSSRQSIGVFEKKAREERATEQLDVLLFKVEECEEEMKRQAEAHQAEILALKEAHQKKLQELSAGGGDNQDKQDIAEVDQMKMKIVELEGELKSKEDLIESYEKILAGDEEDEECEADEEEKEDKHTSAYFARDKSKGKAKKGHRAPLTSISMNAPTH